MSTWNDFFNDARVDNQARLDREARARMSRSHIQDMERMAANYDDLAASAARYLTMREALTRQLARFDPTNPLVVDQKFRNKLMGAGAAAYEAAFKAEKFDQMWDAVIATGRNFPIPGRP